MCHKDAMGVFHTYNLEDSDLRYDGGICSIATEGFRSLGKLFALRSEGLSILLNGCFFFPSSLSPCLPFTHSPSVSYYLMTILS